MPHWLSRSSWFSFRRKISSKLIDPGRKSGEPLNIMWRLTANFWVNAAIRISSRTAGFNSANKHINCFNTKIAFLPVFWNASNARWKSISAEFTCVRCETSSLTARQDNIALSASSLPMRVSGFGRGEQSAPECHLQYQYPLVRMIHIATAASASAARKFRVLSSSSIPLPYQNSWGLWYVWKNRALHDMHKTRIRNACC